MTDSRWITLIIVLLAAVVVIAQLWDYSLSARIDNLSAAVNSLQNEVRAR
jgi:hypothetical protein